MFTREFWLGDNGALIRALRTFAQTAAAMLTVSTFTPFSVGAWGNVLVVSGTAALVSLLMSLDRREALYTAPPAAALAAPAYVEAPALQADYGCGADLR